MQRSRSPAGRDAAGVPMTIIEKHRIKTSEFIICITIVAFDVYVPRGLFLARRSESQLRESIQVLEISPKGKRRRTGK